MIPKTKPITPTSDNGGNVTPKGRKFLVPNLATNRIKVFELPDTISGSRVACSALRDISRQLGPLHEG